MLVAANTLSGSVECGDLDWPPFGPDVAGSASNPIPAQIRYEAIVAAEP